MPEATANFQFRAPIDIVVPFTFGSMQVPTMLTTWW